MSRSFEIVDAKVAEANFFLNSFREAGANFFQARCFFGAFVSSARSITYAIQASIGDLPGFDNWYGEQQNSLRTNSLARFFHEARVQDHHLGLNLVSGGEAISGKNGLRIVHYFGTKGTETPPPKTDVFTACHQYLTVLIEIVYACYIQFGDLIDPKRYYSAEVFSSRGLTIEDAEEEVFGYRGCTEAPEVSVDGRWRIIRASVSPCYINHLFREYIGKELPGNPDDTAV